MLVGVPATIELPAARLVVALGISMFFLMIQNECKPFATAEHNILAELAGAQITVTLLFISMQLVIAVPRVMVFLCVVLNVMAIPLAICFNMRRLTNRKDVLGAFLAKRKVRTTGTNIRQSAALGEFFDPVQFNEYWKAGDRSEFELFSAALKWMDAALERPVSQDRWGELLFALEQMPLASSSNVDVRHGA